MAVQVELREARDIYPEGVLRVHVREQAGVQAMNTFQNDHVTLVQLGHVAFLAQTGLEIVMGQVYFHASDEVAHIMV